MGGHSAKDVGTLLQNQGLYSSPGTALRLLGWERPPWDDSSISCGLAASPLYLRKRHPESLPLANATLPFRFGLWRPRETQAPCSKAWDFTVRPRQPGEFWDKICLLGWLPAFSAVWLLLPSANLKVHLGPCSQPTPQCGPDFACGGLLGDTQTPYSKSWVFALRL